MEVRGGIKWVEDAVVHIVAVACVALVQSSLVLGPMI